MTDILLTTVLGTVTLALAVGSRGCARLVLAAMAVKASGPAFVPRNQTGPNTTGGRPNV